MAMVLVSIKPRFVELILARKKRFELRRGHARIEPGDTLVIYSTNPVKAVVATCGVKQKLTGPPEWLLSRIDGKAGIKKPECRAYLAGARTATALELDDVRKLPKPIPLRRIRSTAGGLAVPRSYRFLSDREAKSLGLT